MRIEGKVHCRGGWLRFKRKLAIDFFDRSGLKRVGILATSQSSFDTAADVICISAETGWLH